MAASPKWRLGCWRRAACLSLTFPHTWFSLSEFLFTGNLSRALLYMRQELFLLKMQEVGGGGRRRGRVAQDAAGAGSCQATASRTAPHPASCPAPRPAGHRILHGLHPTRHRILPGTATCPAPHPAQHHILLAGLGTPLPSPPLAALSSLSCLGDGQGCSRVVQQRCSYGERFRSGFVPREHSCWCFLQKSDC